MEIDCKEFLCEAYDQAVDIECKNQITSRYGTSTQISQISEYDKDEEYKGIEVMELCPRDGNKFTTNRAEHKEASTQHIKGISTKLEDLEVM